MPLHTNCTCCLILGVLLWELWTAAELPYAGLNDQQVTGQVTVPMYYYAREMLGNHITMHSTAGYCWAPP